MSQADAEDRQSALDQRLNGGDGVAAGRRRVARTVGQEDPVRRHLEDSLGRTIGRHHRDLAVERGEAPQDVLLRPEVDRHHVVARVLEPAVAPARRPGGFLPDIALGAGDLLCQVHALEPGPRARGLAHRVQVQRALGIVTDAAPGRPAVPDPAGQGPRVYAAQTDQPVALEPGIEMLGGAPVGRLGDVQPKHQPAREGRGGLHVFPVGADIADMGKGEGDDLSGVGRIGQDLLVAGHRGVEADLADRLSRRADPEALEGRAVVQHQGAGAQPWPGFRVGRPRGRALVVHRASFRTAPAVSRGGATARPRGGAFYQSRAALARGCRWRLYRCLPARSATAVPAPRRDRRSRA